MSFICTNCQLRQSREFFSKSQRRKDKKRCNACLGIERRVIASIANETKGASSSSSSAAPAAASSTLPINRALRNNKKNTADGQNDSNSNVNHLTDFTQFFGGDRGAGFNFAVGSSLTALHQIAAQTEVQLMNEAQSVERARMSRRDEDYLNDDDEDEDESNSIIVDDDYDDDNRKDQPTSHEIYQQDHECPICMEEFPWECEDEHATSTTKKQRQHHHQHPLTPKFLSCSHICCFTCVSKLISTTRDQNRLIIERNNNRLRGGATISSFSRRYQPSSPTSPDSPSTSTEFIGPSLPAPFPRHSSSSFSVSSSLPSSPTTLLASSTAPELEQELKPRCPICRQEFLVATDVPKQIRKKIAGHFSSPKNIERICFDADVKKKNQREKEEHTSHSRLLHLASIGERMLGTVINVNPEKKCGSVMLFETGKCVMFVFNSDKDDKRKNSLQVGAEVVCDIREIVDCSKSQVREFNLNRSRIVLGPHDLVAVNVRIWDELEANNNDKKSKNKNVVAHDDDDDDDDAQFNRPTTIAASSSCLPKSASLIHANFADVSPTTSTVEMNQYNIMSYFNTATLEVEERKRAEEADAKAEAATRAMTSYHYDSSTGRRVYAADDGDNDDEYYYDGENYYDDDADDFYEDEDTWIEDIADKYDRRTSGF